MELGYKLIKSVGDKIGDGLASLGGMAGMGKKLAKSSAPMSLKAVGGSYFLS
jgi:hypothetical protein